jgi:hypothetical protein
VRRVLTLVTLLVTLLVGAVTVSAHGRLETPPSVTNSLPVDSDYQFCFMEGCSCGQDYTGPGPIVATYTEGQTITIVLDITVTHFPGDFFRFQLCTTSAGISEECFSDGEFAAIENTNIEGLQEYQVTLPPGVACNDCMLRWKWDYAFLGCAHVAIEALTLESTQLPGDCNQDGQLDISDGVCLLGFIFGGDPVVLPCGNGTSADPANQQLMSWNDDGEVDLSDAVALFSWIFLGGPAHLLGTECQTVAGCPHACES